MNFLQVQQEGKKISTVSKSRYADYERCPLKAYKQIRETKKNFSRGKMLDVGILGHDIAAVESSRVLGGNYVSTQEDFSLEVVYEVNEEIRGHINFDSLLQDQVLVGIEEQYSIELPDVEDGFSLTVKNDLTTYREIRNIPYTVIYEWKTGYQIASEADSEAILYAYAAYKKYGLPVIFIRLGLRNGKRFVKEFKVEALEAIEPTVINLVKRYKKDMEDTYSPEFRPGSHCQYCDYIASCDGRKYIASLRHKYKAAIWAKEFAKKYDAEVKAAAKEILEKEGKPSVGESSVLIPFLEGRYGAIASTSSSFQLATRKIKKADIIAKLVEAGRLEEFLPNLELKFDEEVAKKLSEEFEIPFKEVIRTSIKLEEVEGEDDE